MNRSYFILAATLGVAALAVLSFALAGRPSPMLGITPAGIAPTFSAETKPGRSIGFQENGNGETSARNAISATAQSLINQFLESYDGSGSPIPADVSLALADSISSVGIGALDSLVEAIRGAETAAAKGILAHALAGLDCRASAEALVDLIENESESIAQAEIADSLMALSDPVAIAFLAKLAAEDVSPIIFASVSEAVAYHADESMIGVLVADGGQNAGALIAGIRSERAEESLQGLVYGASDESLTAAAATAIAHFENGRNFLELAVVMALDAPGGFERSHKLEEVLNEPHPEIPGDVTSEDFSGGEAQLEHGAWDL